MGQDDGEGHALLRLICSVAEHQALPSRARERDKRGSEQRQQRRTVQVRMSDDGRYIIDMHIIATLQPERGQLERVILM